MFKDRFLVGIVAGIILLIGAAFAITQFYPKAKFLSDGSANSAAYNYILALEKKDYPRAYMVLSPSLPCYPKQESQFIRQLNIIPSDASWKINSENSLTESGYKKQVKVEFTSFRRSFLFFSQFNTYIVQMTWVNEFDKWRLVEVSGYYPYQRALFNQCWVNCNNCGP